MYLVSLFCFFFTGCGFFADLDLSKRRRDENEDEGCDVVDSGMDI